MKKKIWIGIAVFAGFALVVRLLLGSPGPMKSAMEQITRGTIVESVYGIGTLNAQRSLQIKSGVTTSIRKFYVKEGDAVRAGQRLVELDGVGAFTAPFAGVVSNLSLKQGETVFAQTAVMTLTDPNDLYISVTIEQGGALKIKAGLPVKVSFDGLRERSFAGRVESVYSSGSDFLARISVQDLPQYVLPGMSADVAILLDEKKNALLIPVAALDGKVANIIRNGKTMKVNVELGLVDGAMAEIVQGDIQAGDQVLIRRLETR